VSRTAEKPCKCLKVSLARAVSEVLTRHCRTFCNRAVNFDKREDWESRDKCRVEDSCSSAARNADVDSVMGGGIDVAVVER
jgi:hypothetical protein